jgi:hypothetical protein
MPKHSRLSSARRPLFVALGAAAIAMLAGGAPPTAAEDTRPKEIPYTGPGPVPLLDPSYRMVEPKLVLIADQEVRPKAVVLNEGELVAWISYSKLPSEIVFEREVAKSMICHSLVNFSIKEDEIRSSPIHAGEFASFCQLKPGRYRYLVVRPTGSDSAASAATRLEGEIIVKAAPAEEKK